MYLTPLAVFTYVIFMVSYCTYCMVSSCFS